MANQLASLVESEKIEFLSPGTISRIDDRTIKKLGEDSRKNFYSQLTSKQLATIATVGGDGLFLKNKKINIIEDPNAIKIEVLEEIGAEAMASFSGEQFAKFDEEHLEAIGLGQASQLRREQIEALYSANKLHHLQSDVLAFLSKENRIGALPEEQLISLIESDKLRIIPWTMDTMKDKFADISDSKLLQHIFETEFDYGANLDGNDRISIAGSPEERVSNIVSRYTEEKDHIPILSDNAGPQGFIERQIRHRVENENWRDIPSFGLGCAVEYKDSGKIIQGALGKGIESYSENVYTLIDTANRLRARIPFGNDKSAQSDYVGFMEAVELLVQVAKYDSTDKYVSTIDFMLSLSNDKHLDISYRSILAEELAGLAERFRAACYGTKRAGDLHKFTQEKLEEVYLTQAKIIAEKHNLDTNKFAEKLEQEIKTRGSKYALEHLTSCEIDYLEAVTKANEVNPLGSKGIGAMKFYYSEGLKTLLTLVTTHALAKFVKSAGSSVVATAVGTVGINMAARGLIDATRLDNYMRLDEGAKKEAHRREKKASEEEEKKPFRRFMNFLKASFSKIFGRKRQGQGDIGFGRRDYKSFKGKSVVQNIRKSHVEEFGRNAQAEEKRKYFECLEGVNGHVLGHEKTEKQGSERNRAKTLTNDLAKMKQMLLECWFARKVVELETEYQEHGLRFGRIQKRKSQTPQASSATDTTGILSRDAPKGPIFTAANIINDIVRGSESISQWAVASIEERLRSNNIEIGDLPPEKKVEFIRKVQNVQSEGESYLIKLEENTANRIARSNGEFREKLNEITTSYKERQDKISEAMKRFSLNLDSREANIDNINIPAKNNRNRERSKNSLSLGGDVMSSESLMGVLDNLDLANKAIDGVEKETNLELQ
jgi:hypothetical protein